MKNHYIKKICIFSSLIGIPIISYGAYLGLQISNANTSVTNSSSALTNLQTTADTASNSQSNSKQIGQQKNITKFNSGYDFNFNNNMDNITSFLYNSKIHYIANNKDNTGILVYDDSYNLIASSFISDMAIGSKQATLISDVATGTDGQYVYMSVSYITRTTRFGAFWKLDISNNTTSLIAEIPLSKSSYGGNAHDDFNSCNAIGVIPATSGDMIIGFPEWIAGTTACSQYIDYVVMNPKTKHVYCHSDSSGLLFSLSLNRRIMVQDFYISRSSITNTYDMQIYGRSRDTGWSDNTIFNKAWISFDSTFTMTVKNTGHDLSKTLNNWNPSNDRSGQNYASPLLYDHFGALTTRPQYTTAFVKYPDSSHTDTEMVTFDKNSAPSGGNVDQNPVIYKTNKSRLNVQGEINKDASAKFSLLSNDKSVANNNHKSISITNNIDTDYHLPQNNANIEGISWGDTGETKLELFDGNGMVSQYDTTNDTYTLKKGIEFKDSISPTLKHQLPSQVNDSDIKNLVQQTGITSTPANTKISKTYNDSTGELTVHMYAYGDDGVGYDATHTYTGFLTNDFPNANWKATWLSNGDSSIVKTQLPSKIDDATIKNWVTIGSNLNYYKVNDPKIVKNDDDGTITITLSYDNLPKGLNNTYSNTYSGFYKISDYTFDSSNWSDFTNKAMLPSQVSDTDINHLIKKPAAIKLVSPQPPIVITKNNGNGVIEVSYDYTGSIPLLPAGITLHPSHTYGGFEKSGDCTVALDSAKLASFDKNRLASVVSKTEVNALLKLSSQMDGLKLSPTTVLKPNDDKGELSFTVTYQNAPPGIQSVYDFTITGFQVSSLLEVTNWGDISNKAMSPLDFDTNNKTAVITKMLNDKEIVVSSALQSKTPSITSDINNANGTVDITLGYTINNVVHNFTHQYSGFYNLKDYSVSIDDSKIDKNKLASAVTVSDIQSNLSRSTAVNEYYSNNEKVSLKADDDHATLIATVTYKDLESLGVPYTFSLKLTDFNFKIAAPSNNIWIYVGAGAGAAVLLIIFATAIIITKKKKSSRTNRNSNRNNRDSSRRPENSSRTHRSSSSRTGSSSYKPENLSHTNRSSNSRTGSSSYKPENLSHRNKKSDMSKATPSRTSRSSDHRSDDPKLRNKYGAKPKSPRK